MNFRTKIFAVLPILYVIRCDWCGYLKSQSHKKRGLSAVPTLHCYIKAYATALIIINGNLEFMLVDN